MQNIKLIIGLGNPDSEYQNTYHNTGHIAADFLSAKLKDMPILKSDTYMNKSGEFVKEIIKKYKTKPENLLIIHDDSDIELGRYKLSFGKSSAGHRGVQNTINQLKTQNFWRLRIGIRPAKERIRTKAEELVLRKISTANKKKMWLVFGEILKKINPENSS